MINVRHPEISIQKTNLTYNKKTLISLFTFLNLAITIPLAAILNIWLDEYYTISTSSHGIKYAFQQALFFELQPPLYYVILSVWLKLNNSIFFARFFSIICITFSIYISILLAKRYLKNINPEWLLACISLNPFSIYAAIETRPPALGILLSSLMLLFFFDGYLSKETSQKSRFLYIFTSVLAVYTQYYIGFLVVANFFVILTLWRIDRLRSYLIDITCIGISLIPIILIVPHQIHAHAIYTGINIQGNIYGASVIKAISFVFERMSFFILPSNLIPGFLARIFRVCLFSFLFYLLIKRSRRFTENDRTIWIMVFALLFLLVPLFFLVGPRLMQPRHLSVLFLPTMLLLCTSLRFIKISKKQYISSLGVMPILLTYLLGNYLTYKSMAKPGDWKRVASYINSIEQPNVPIVVFNGSLAPLLNYYYTGKNPIIPMPKAEYYNDINSYSEIRRDNILKTLSCVESHNNYFFLVNSTYLVKSKISANSSLIINSKTKDPTELNNITLEDFIEKNFDTELKKEFRSTKVRFLKKKKLDSNLNRDTECKI